MTIDFGIPEAKTRQRKCLCGQGYQGFDCPCGHGVTFEAKEANDRYWEDFDNTPVRQRIDYNLDIIAKGLLMLESKAAWSKTTDAEKNRARQLKNEGWQPTRRGFIDLKRT